MSHNVYVLLHTYETKFGIETKLIGNFSSREKAEEEKKKREKLQGFIDYPKGFRIEVYEIDKDRCQEIIYLT
ncbi:DUF7336 domain-containing protein [Neisseria sp. Ec49-e6-T10]|uniref:DUF7336 domain-containing protein n=1 Tax=Neisseria sp. Ec49-e6-T10 TaxID=3140744 RepID=UPI003EBBD897